MGWKVSDLTHKAVLITGGSRGLGLVLAREYAARGARVAICARDGLELTRALQDLRARGAKVSAYLCDLREPAQIVSMMRKVRHDLGPLDVLVNNAGIIQVAPLEEMRLADFEEAMLTHFWGPLWTIWEALPEMKRRRSGRIVNISSIGGKIAVPHLLPYDASKFALAGLSQGLSAELAQHGVRVTTVYPGLMRTGSPRNAVFKGQHRREYAWFAISDSLPVLTMSAERAARQILHRSLAGDSEVFLTFSCWAAAKLHGLFPSLVIGLLRVVNKLLPGPGGMGPIPMKGSESQSKLSTSFLTALTKKAARENNQILEESAHGSSRR